jgi:hypothetical protein
MSKGIDALCTALNELPLMDAEYLLVVACGALGQGLDAPDEEENEKKSVEHLKLRMEELVESQRIWPPFLVQGLVAYLVDYWEELADPDETSKSIAALSRLERSLDKDLITPEEARFYKGSEFEIEPFRKRVQDWRKNAHKDRRQAERVFLWLQRLKSERLNNKFWGDPNNSD